MIKKAVYVTVICVSVALVAVIALQQRFPIGPIVLALGLIPIAGLLLARRRLTGAVPDMVFGALDTGLLVIPALGGASRLASRARLRAASSVMRSPTPWGDFSRGA